MTVVEIINGKGDESDIAGWVLLFDGAVTWIGKAIDARAATAHTAPVRLSPVYELQVSCQAVRGPNGQPGINRNFAVIPPRFLSSLRSLDFPGDAVTVKLSTLSGPERRRIVQGVAQCEEMLGIIRAADAGVVLAQPGPVKV